MAKKNFALIPQGPGVHRTPGGVCIVLCRKSKYKESGNVVLMLFQTNILFS